MSTASKALPQHIIVATYQDPASDDPAALHHFVKVVASGQVIEDPSALIAATVAAQLSGKTILHRSSHRLHAAAVPE